MTEKGLLGFAAQDSAFPNGRIFYEDGVAPHAIIWSFEFETDSSGGGVVVDVPAAPNGFALDADNVYFVSGDGPSSLSSHSFRVFSATSTFLTGSDESIRQPVVADASLYYLHQHEAGECAGAVMVIPTTGGTPTQVSLGRSGSDVSSLAVDHAFVYWTTFDAGGVVFRAPRNGGTPEILATGQREARAVTFDDTRVYWLVTDAAGGQVRALAK